MTLTEQQRHAAANLALVYPAAIGIDATRPEAIAVYDELVTEGHAVAVETDDPGLPDGRMYQLSETAAEAHRQAIRHRAEQAELN